MTSTKKIFAAVLSLTLIQLSLEPAWAVVRGATPRGPAVQLRLEVTTAPTGTTVSKVPAAGIPASETRTVLPPVPDALHSAIPMDTKAAEVLGAAAAPTPGAKSLLEQIGGDIASPAAQDPSRLGSAIDPYYTGGRKLSENHESAVTATEAGTHASGLKPSSPAERQAESSTVPGKDLSRNSKPGRSSWIRIAAGFLMAAVILVITSCGKSKSDLWESSKSNQDIVAIEKARRAGDAETLIRIAREARTRQARSKELVADAKSRGSKTVNNATKDDVKTAQAYEAFDGLVGARGETNGNAVSRDPQQRIGEELPATWQERIAAAEAEARRSGFEGALALQLEALRSELGRENAAAGRIEGDIKSFDEQVPFLFGGRLKEQSAKAQQDLDEFKNTELTPEEALYQAAAASMRQRVSARLAQKSQEFQGHLSRMDRLAGLAEGQLKSAAELARAIDDDLRDMAVHRHNEAYNLLMASQNERVAVRKPAFDRHGNPVYDAKGNRVYRTVYEDQSGPYRALAASEASAAQASAAGAKRGLEILRGMIASLHRDSAIQAEGLGPALPSGTNGTQIDPGHGPIFDFWADSTWAFFSNQFSEAQASEARARFGGVVEPLNRVEQEVARRRGAEAGWLQEQIEREIDRQAAEARKR